MPHDPEVRIPSTQAASLIMRPERMYYRTPQHPAEKPHPEQTASWLSFHTYSHLNPVVTAANKVAHLPAEELPPLADYDRADALIKRAYPVRILLSICLERS